MGIFDRIRFCGSVSFEDVGNREFVLGASRKVREPNTP